MAKRQLRSSTAAEAAAAPNTQATTKKQKVAPVKYLCTSCSTERVASAFPDYNPSAECEHLINTCKNCLKLWVRARIESGVFITGGEDGKTFGVKCPQCPAVMRNVNIEIAATKKDYAQFEKRERHFIAENTPGWRWCLQPDCKAGQVHEKKNVPEIVTAEKGSSEKESAKEAVESENAENVIEKEEATPKKKGKSKAKSKKTKTVTAKADQEEQASEKVSQPELVEDICTCHECGAKACVNCERPWHEGETCKQYRARVQNRFDEEDLSIREIEKVTRKCPSCSKNIQKNGGCPSMRCTECNTAFCWTCMSVWDQGYCKCHPRPPPQPVNPTGLQNPLQRR